MITYENQCVSCDLPCIGSACKYRKVMVVECDECHCDCDEYYIYEGKELCDYCLSEMLLEDFKNLSVDEQIDALSLNDKVEIVRP